MSFIVNFFKAAFSWLGFF
jgi:GTP-binding protein SAR1